MNKRLLYVCCFILSCIIVLSQCVSKQRSTDLRGEQFAGAATCAGCHKNIYDSYLATAHYNTSHPASLSTVKGNFNDTFIYSNVMKVVMEARDSGLFQAGYVNDTLQELHRFDIAIGSGRKAQTFLYWEAGKYFQMPVSYFVSAHAWANSPGFPAVHPKFDRMIPSTCFGCHSSMVGVKSTEMTGLHITEQFEKNQLVYGIDCERCHGPGAEHVAFHTAHPQEQQAKYMTKTGSLKNQQKLDMCAVCHSGLKTPQRSVFDFRPGDKLSDYIYADISRSAKPSEMDVHGTQYQLFTASKCYIKSENMNCSSCHNPHSGDKQEVFSQRCMSCHTTASHNFCKLTTLPEAVLAKSCIDCHMPALPSGSITLLTNGHLSPTPDSIRTHLITVYGDETKKVIARLTKKL